MYLPKNAGSRTNVMFISDLLLSKLGVKRTVWVLIHASPGTAGGITDNICNGMVKSAHFGGQST